MESELHRMLNSLEFQQSDGNILNATLLRDTLIGVIKHLIELQNTEILRHEQELKALGIDIL